MGSLIRGLPLSAIEGSSPSHPPIPPTLGGGDGWISLSRPTRPAWNQQLAKAMIYNFSVGTGSRFSCQPGSGLPQTGLSWMWSDKGIFIGRPSILMMTPVKILLPRLQLKRDALWEDVVSLLKKGSRRLFSRGWFLLPLLPG